MKNLKLNIAFVAVFAMLFASCSKEETGVQGADSEKVSLTFGAIVNDADTRASTKQAIGEIPGCSNDDPAYIRIVLMRGDTQVVGTTENPYKVDLAAGELFTIEDPMLQLSPGTYTLTHFTVYNADDEVIWIAPRNGALANFVDNPLPREIDLRAGVKKYVEIDVLCYDNRDVNEYGYLFFEINTTEALEFCFFANYCNEDGRHFPARYSVKLWAGTDATGDLLYSDLENVVGTNDNGDFFASPLCLALPTNAEMDVDYIYYEITLLDWTDNYGDVDQVENVQSGTLSRADIEGNFGANDEVEYEHLRFGCGNDEPNDGDQDGDGVPDSVDQCDNTPAGTNVNAVGCPEQTDGDGDSDGVKDSVDQCPNTPAGTNVDAVGCPVQTDGDADSDGVKDSVDQCPNTPAGTNVDAVGCPVDTAGCIPAPGTGCSTLTFTQTVNLDPGLPVGQDPFYFLIVDGEQVGTITFDLEASGEDNMMVLVDLFEGWSATDAEVSLPAFVNTQICVGDLNENDFSINYIVDANVFEEGIDFPVEVEFSANICQN